jgi:hypothetical protein
MGEREDAARFLDRWGEAYVERYYDGSIERMVEDVLRMCRECGSQDVSAHIIHHRLPFCMAILQARMRTALDSVKIQEIMDVFPLDG